VSPEDVLCEWAMSEELHEVTVNTHAILAALREAGYRIVRQRQVHIGSLARRDTRVPLWVDMEDQ
jgi:hypothetical protein